MPDINLEINGKEAIGDGSKIVCMNKDYIVHFNFTDNTEFLNLPLKFLVVKYDRYYEETPIHDTVENNITSYSSHLPLIENQKFVYLGVVGKDNNGEPVFTSKSAKYDCLPSVLCGTVVNKAPAVFGSIVITKNGSYFATDEGVDGFNRVQVEVLDSPVEEIEIVDIDFGNGDVVISPSTGGNAIKQVVVRRPDPSVASYIKMGEKVVGIEGTYEVKLDKHTFTENGDYRINRDTYNVDALDRVIVDVPIPEGYLLPAGTLTVTNSGLFDVGPYKNVEVLVSGEGNTYTVQSASSLERAFVVAEPGSYIKYIGPTTGEYTQGDIFYVNVANGN